MDVISRRQARDGLAVHVDRHDTVSAASNSPWASTPRGAGPIKARLC